MREQYSEAGQEVTGVARYSNFRRFRVTTETVIMAPLRPPPGDAQAAAVCSFCSSPDGRRVATAGGDGRSVIRDTRWGQIRVLAGHTAPVWNLSWSPDGASLASVALEPDVRI